MLQVALLLCVAAFAPDPGLQTSDDAVISGLPKVVIVGDSIRLSYAPTVVQQLAGKAIVVSPEANGGDSSNVLRNLDQWVIDEKPAIVQFNCGIHDTKKFKSTGKFQVSPEQYEENLRKIVERVRKETGAVVLFATTTPVLDDRAAQSRRDRDYELLGASVRQYNAIAKKVMQELEVPINDLHSVLSDPGQPFKAENLIGSDGVHLQSEAKELLGKAVAAFIRAQLSSSQQRDEPVTQPNIVLIVADDLRADIVSPYGGPVKTPNLDKLAVRGVLFRRATCGYPICHVSRSEMLTGRFLVTEAAAGGAIPLHEEWALWPDVMQQAGWHTVHCGKWHVQGTPWTRGYVETEALYSGGGGARGQPLSYPHSATGRPVTGYTGWTFKTNDNQPLPDLGIGLTPETDARIADGAIAAIRQARPGQATFLHVNFTAPHDPLHWPQGREHRFRTEDIKLPANFRPQHPFDHGNIGGRDEAIVPAPRASEDVRRELAVYYALVENLDAQVGRIVKALEDKGELARTVIMFTSDQGLALGSHGLMGKQNQYEHTANVPLIMAGPGVPAGKQLGAQCALRDLFPTVCEMTGVTIPESVQGHSLVPVLQGWTTAMDAAVFGYFTDTQRMIRTSDGWKLIWYPKARRVQLFQVTEDPDELQDHSEEEAHQDRLKRLKSRLTLWLRDQGDALAR